MIEHCYTRKGCRPCTVYTECTVLSKANRIGRNFAEWICLPIFRADSKVVESLAEKEVGHWIYERNLEGIHWISLRVLHEPEGTKEERRLIGKERSKESMRLKNSLKPEKREVLKNWDGGHDMGFNIQKLVYFWWVNKVHTKGSGRGTRLRLSQQTFIELIVVILCMSLFVLLYSFFYDFG